MSANVKKQISESQKTRWKQKPELHALVSSKLKVSPSASKVSVPVLLESMLFSVHSYCADLWVAALYVPCATAV